MKWFWNLLLILLVILLIYFGLAYFGIIRDPVVINKLSEHFGGSRYFTPACFLKDLSGCYQLKLRMRDGELPSFDKILEGNISKTQCNLSGYIYSDETSKWRLIGEIFEAEDRIEIKIVKQTSSFEDSLSLITFNNIGVRQIESLSGTVENEEGRAIGRAKLIRCLNKVSEHEEDVYNNTKENIKTNHVYYVQVLCSSNYKAIEREVREKMSEFISGNLQLHIKNNQAANCTRMMIGEFNDISSAKIFRDKYDLPYGRGVIVECFEGSDGKEIISTITE